MWDSPVFALRLRIVITWFEGLADTVLLVLGNKLHVPINEFSPTGYLIQDDCEDGCSGVYPCS